MRGCIILRRLAIALPRETNHTAPRACRLAYTVLTNSVATVPNSAKTTCEDIASERKKVSKMSAVSCDRVDIIAPSRPHSRVGVILGFSIMKAHEAARKLNKYSRGSRSFNQRRQNPWDPNSSSTRILNLDSKKRRFTRLRFCQSTR